MSLDAGGGEITQLLTSGPFGIIIAGLLYYINNLLKERREARDAHHVEIAAERKRNEDLQNARLADHKVLIEIAQSMRDTMVSIENKLENDTIGELTEKIGQLVAKSQGEV